MGLRRRCVRRNIQDNVWHGIITEEVEVRKVIKDLIGEKRRM
jgi:hypothetical protein